MISISRMRRVLIAHGYTITLVCKDKQIYARSPDLLCRVTVRGAYVLAEFGIESSFDRWANSSDYRYYGPLNTIDTFVELLKLALTALKSGIVPDDIYVPLVIGTSATVVPKASDAYVAQLASL